MKKTTKLITLLLVVIMQLGILARLSSTASADSTSLDLANWLVEIPDQTPLSSLSIPGSHDTMAYQDRDGWAPEHMWKTQDLSLNKQLEIGVRYLDLRVASDLSMHHGNVDLGTYFDKDVMPTIKDYLAKHPSEFIIARIKHEDGDANNFKNNIKTVINQYRDLFYQPTSYDTPTVKELRGKVLVLDNTPDGRSFTSQGTSYSWWNEPHRMALQDNYDNPTYEKKYQDIVNFIEQTNNSNDGRLYLNHLSATGNWAGLFLIRKRLKHLQNI